MQPSGKPARQSVPKDSWPGTHPPQGTAALPGGRGARKTQAGCSCFPPGPACHVLGFPRVRSRQHPLGWGRRSLSCPPAGIPTGGVSARLSPRRGPAGPCLVPAEPPRVVSHLLPAREGAGLVRGLVLRSPGVNPALRRAVCSPAASRGFLFSSPWGFRACRFVSLPGPHVEPGPPHRPEGFLARRGWRRNDFPSFALNPTPLIPRGPRSLPLGPLPGVPLCPPRLTPESWEPGEPEQPAPKAPGPVPVGRVRLPSTGAQRAKGAVPADSSGEVTLTASSQRE